MKIFLNKTPTLLQQDPVDEQGVYGKRTEGKRNAKKLADIAPAADIPLYDYDEAEIDLLRQPREQSNQVNRIYNLGVMKGVPPWQAFSVTKYCIGC